MNLKTRLDRIEAAANEGQASQADQAYNDYFAAMAEIIYNVDDPVEQRAKVDALGLRPPAVTESSRAFERALQMAYGDSSPIKEARRWTLNAG